MKTLTVRLPNNLASQIENESRARGLSKSDVVRERLTGAGPADNKLPASYLAIADLIGSIDDPRLPRDLSARKNTTSRRPVMAATVVVDASFLVALLLVRDTNHSWASRQVLQYPPWNTCEAAISETFHMLGPRDEFVALLRRAAIAPAFQLEEATEPVLRLMQKYADVPMSFADACLVRMTEVLPDPVLLTTDSDFRIYRRHDRRVILLVMPD
jgi:predicted nucleic acid-binding protein